MLPYDGMTRTGSKGVSHCGGFYFAQTPSEVRKLLEMCGKGKHPYVCYKVLFDDL